MVIRLSQEALYSLTPQVVLLQASSSVSTDGTASATLTSGNPIPSNGLAIITAQVGASASVAKMGKGAKAVPFAKSSVQPSCVDD